MMQFMLDDEHPFRLVALCSYDTLSGIKLIFQWVFSDKVDFPYLKDVLKLSLNHIYRQDTKSIDSFPCLNVDMPEIDVSFTSSLFSCKNGATTTYYSFLFIFYSSKMLHSPYIITLLEDQVLFCAKVCQSAFQNGKDLYSQTHNIRTAVDNITQFMFSPKIKQPLNVFNISNISSSSEQNFFATAITSHLQTQMTTVIEIEDENNKDYLPLYDLLSKITLPEQLSLSSPKPQAFPTPGLFLQVTYYRSPNLPYEHLMQFRRPWTWIRFFKRKIVQMNDFEIQEITRLDYRTNILFEPDADRSEIQKRFMKIKRGYNPEECTASAWANEIIHYLFKIPSHFINNYLNQKLIDELNKSMTFMKMVDDAITKGGGTFLQPDQLNFITKVVDLKDNEEIKIAVALAQIFDKRVFRHVFAGRKEVLMQLIVTI